MTIPEPSAEHQWLERMLGDWSYEHETPLEPGGVPVKLTGVDRVRSLGSFWVICEAEGDMPGGGINRSVMTIGYDPAKKRFVGTFIASAMASLWVYDGHLDPATDSLILGSEGPSFADPAKIAQYHDIIQFVNPDHRILASEYRDDDGQWHRFMTAHYRRQRSL